MKKLIFLFTAMLALISIAGCKSYDVTNNRVGYSSVADISVKDYEVKGVIRLESQEVATYGPLGIHKSFKGSHILWSELMAEAAKLGADDIINVRIEVTNKNERKPRFIEFFTGYTDTLLYRATALAIKYTDPVDRGKSGLLYDLSDQDSK
jgi:hypothetical protein